MLVRLFPERDFMAFEQLLLNYLLQKGSEELRWAVFNPLYAHSGMFLTSAVLSDTVHHATSSSARLRDKLRFMEASLLFTEDLREFCALNGAKKSAKKSEGRSEGPPKGSSLSCLSSLSSLSLPYGPHNEFCFFFLAEDPHFGGLLEPFRLRRGFSAADNALLLSRLREAPKKAWLQMIMNFNDGGYKFYKQRRRNSSRLMAEILFHPAF